MGLWRRLKFWFGSSFGGSFYATYNGREVTREEWDKLVKPAFDKMGDALTEMGEALKKMKP